MIKGYADNPFDQIPNVDIMYNDDVTYSNPYRPKLTELLNDLKPGDIIAVKSLAQLNWGIRNLVTLVTELLDKDVTIKVVDINVDLVDHQALITDIANSDKRRFAKIKESTQRGGGRQFIKIDPKLWNAYYTLVKEKSITKTEMAYKLGLTLPTFYRRFRKYEKSLQQNDEN